MPARKDIKKILIIGSGPIVIGQACEFDYSGTQAVKALKEEGYEVILVNPNPATVMTTPGVADVVYMEPLEPEYVEEILKKEKPDAILPTMGGQTALNLALELEKLGLLEKYNVELIGASTRAIELAEDRQLFKETVTKIGLDVPASALVNNIPDGVKFADETGFPIILRPSYTLGGRGGAIAEHAGEFEHLLEKALLESPTNECLIEESLIGWKEFEMEVMRDSADNAVIVCSIENIDPMGIHTGDSITVAPIQTLSDTEYQVMRTAAIETLRAIGVDCGGSNVQFATNPETGRMIIIEMNPRVSRSSALASKATGFPIARISAKLSIGYTLDEIMNEITGKTVSCFEPTLDYCAVKVPRFEMEKFPSGYKTLGTQMKSVGESLALGRTYPEALNKALRSAEFGFDGLCQLDIGYNGLDEKLEKQHPLRMFAIYTVLSREGERAIDKLSKTTGFDIWFLYQMLDQINLEEEISRKGLDKDYLLEAKRFGLSDKRIAKVAGLEEKQVTDLREENGINATYHFVDTCAGEFSAQTPYFYSTYGEIDEGGALEDDSVIILGSGPNRIGQGLEFDTSCTLASLAYQREGKKTILVNSNPETVSTDFNVSDRLYIEPLTFEYVQEILKKEKTNKVVVQLGGQIPLNIARELEAAGAEIIGTSVKSIYDVEDRGLFSDLVNKLELNQPDNRMAANADEVMKYSEEIGFPVLLRPSFVLGGRSMFVAYKREELATFLLQGIEMSKEKPILVDQFLEDAFEYDVDAVSDGENVYVAGIMQHIEAAGVHSGDSACVFPPFKAEKKAEDEMMEAAQKFARELKVKGFLNIQFALKDGTLYVLEVNPRASRTIPFLSKASGVDLIEAAVRVWNGISLEEQGLTKNGIGRGTCQTGWAVKEAVFSFDRFAGEDPLLGPEMKSTGEVIGTGTTFGESFAKASIAASVNLPKPSDGKVFVSVHDRDKDTILPIIKTLRDLGFEFAATRGTAEFLYANGIWPEVVMKVHDGRPNVVDHMRAGKISLLINTPLGRFSQKGDHDIRIEAVRSKIPYTTTTSAAEAAAVGIKHLLTEKPEVRAL
ncbi:MAG: carbamoyl-phosphate synthase large subunit [Spirochaetales bacterium]|uniref:Carbamoyl-phosphate synthase large subunit n=1 Tax=Candidatus Thalassospirochaeta sargassi TaxID=3119039 RepID=A0AAJ1IFJ7_9SPIO|nr:carbamoyl-phosphate synthase large subunit [Spirochaetales bacterium]